MRCPEQSAMPHEVFITYSSTDKLIADAVCARLEAAGLRCWIAPRDISPGQDWTAAILSAIESSSAIVLVFSTHANESPHVKREVERGIHKGSRGNPFPNRRRATVRESRVLNQHSTLARRDHTTSRATYSTAG